MSKASVKSLCLALFFFSASAASAIDVPLTYLKYSENQAAYLPAGLAFVSKTLESPVGNWILPDFISSKPVYARIKLGDKERLLILDRQRAEDGFYNRIFFDANGNKDLTDDPVIEGTLKPGPNQSYQRTRFPPVDTKIAVDGKSLPFSFVPELFGRMSTSDMKNMDEAVVERMINLYIRTNCLYRGKFEIDGESFFVFLGDANCNGSFDEKFALRGLGTPLPGRMPILSTGDLFCISQDENIGAHDQQVCGNWLLIKNKLFAVKIDHAKERMILKPVTKGLVSMELSMHAEYISFYSEGGEHFLMTYQPDIKIDIPKGKYRFYNYRLLKQDDQGDLWSLTARATTESPWIILDGNGTPELKFGEPLAISAEVPRNRRVNILGSPAVPSIVYLSLSIRGQGNEDISDISHIRGNKTKIPLSEKEGLTHRPKEPTFTVLKADGEIAAQGSFEYG
jgi:hypothetical protein